MAQRKPYNPNTAYGRRKLREEAQKYYDNLPPEEKANWDATKFIILLVIVIIVVVIMIATGDTKSGMKWLTR